MSYRYLDDITMADVAFQAQGRNLAELFTSAWEATLSVMIEEAAALANHTCRQITVEEPKLDLLLYSFLQELIYYKDAETLLLRLEHCRIEAGTAATKLEALATGEQIDVERHRLGTDVKAVTFHKFSLSKDGEIWRTTVVLDV